jgi:hypothetical protein
MSYTNLEASFIDYWYFYRSLFSYIVRKEDQIQPPYRTFSLFTLKKQRTNTEWSKGLYTWRLQYNHQVHRDFLISLYYPQRSIWTQTQDSFPEFSYIEGCPCHPPTWLKFYVVLFSRDTASIGPHPLSFVFFPIYHQRSTCVSQSSQINPHHRLNHILCFFLSYKVLVIPTQQKTRNFTSAARSFISTYYPRRTSSQSSSVATPPSHNN